MKFLYYLLVLFIILSFTPSDSDNGKKFMGEWESHDSLHIRIEIKPKTLEGRIVDERFLLVIKVPENQKTIHGLINNQYNYRSSVDEHTPYPFRYDFLYENTFRDTMNFLALKHEDTMIRKYKGLEDQVFIRIKN